MDFSDENYLPDLSENIKNFQSQNYIDFEPPIKRQKSNEEKKNIQTKNLDTKTKKQVLKEQKLQDKLVQKQLKEAEKNEKKKFQEYEATKRRLELETKRKNKPGECLKLITVMIDPDILKCRCGPSVLRELQESGSVRYEVQKQAHPNLITFWREETSIKEKAQLQLDTVTNEVLQDDIILLLPALTFVNQFHNQKHGLNSADDTTLRKTVSDLKSIYHQKKITLLVNGIDAYLRDLKTLENRKYREKITGESKKYKKKEVQQKVTRIDIEEATIDLQLHMGCTVLFIEKDVDVAKTIIRFSKSIAEAPLKKDRLNTGFSFHIDGSGGVKVTKEGQGLSRVWRQQLQQFKNVSADVANAIIAKYPSPRSLYQAYKKCSSSIEAENLLQDLLVRRGAGVVETSRRVGKELSKRLHMFFTQTNGELLLT